MGDEFTNIFIYETDVESFIRELFEKSTMGYVCRRQKTVLSITISVDSFYTETTPSTSSLFKYNFSHLITRKVSVPFYSSLKIILIYFVYSFLSDSLFNVHLFTFSCNLRHEIFIYDLIQLGTLKPHLTINLVLNPRTH